MSKNKLRYFYSLNADLEKRNIKTFTDLDQLKLDDTKTLQLIAYNMPALSTLILECGEKTSSGWKSQIPVSFGLLEITKYYTSRVIFRYYPISKPEEFYLAAYNENETPSLKGFKKYNGVSI